MPDRDDLLDFIDDIPRPVWVGIGWDLALVTVLIVRQFWH